jgi:hypothetical protein
LIVWRLFVSRAQRSPLFEIARVLVHLDHFIIADNLSKSGWSWGCVSAIDSNGRTIWIADAHRDDGNRFVVRADEMLTAFIELESATRACGE